MNAPLSQVTIAEITHLLTTDFDSHHLIETIIERARRTFDAVWCVLLLRVPDSSGVEIVCESTETGFEPHRELLHRNPVVLSASTGSVVMIDDFEIASPRWRSFADAAREVGLGACRVFPLRLAEKPLGAMAVFTANPWNAQSRDNASGQSLADLAAIAMSMSGIGDRAEAATITAQQFLLSRTTLEHAVGMIAELDQIGVDAARDVLVQEAKAHGLTLARYAERVVEDPNSRR